MPNRSHRSNTAEHSHILEVINDVFARHRDGTLSELGSRRALSAFIASYSGGDLLNPDDALDFDTYLERALQISQKATSSYDTNTAACARVIMAVAIGTPGALKAIRRTPKAGSKSEMPMDCV